MSDYNLEIQHHAKYKALVIKAGLVPSSDELYRLHVAECAYEVSELKIQGKVLFTSVQYAKAINIPNVTMIGWVSTYRNVVLKLGLEIKTRQDWKNATKSNLLVKKEKSVSRKRVATINKKFNKNIPVVEKPVKKSKVAGIFESIQKGEVAVQNDILNSLSSTQHTYTTLRNRALTDVDDEVLAALMSTMDECSDFINDYLTTKKEGVKIFNDSDEQRILQ